VRARDAREYIESVYRERIENLMKEVSKERAARRLHAVRQGKEPLCKN